MLISIYYRQRVELLYIVVRETFSDNRKKSKMLNWKTNNTFFYHFQTQNPKFS